MEGEFKIKGISKKLVNLKVLKENRLLINFGNKKKIKKKKAYLISICDFTYSFKRIRAFVITL